MSTMELFGGILMFLMAAAVVASILRDITDMAEKWKSGANVPDLEVMPGMPPVKTPRQLHRHHGVSIEEITLERP